MGVSQPQTVDRQNFQYNPTANDKQARWISNIDLGQKSINQFRKSMRTWQTSDVTYDNAGERSVKSGELCTASIHATSKLDKMDFFLVTHT